MVRQLYRLGPSERGNQGNGNGAPAVQVDSISGRFINQDPIRLFGGENFYHFAFNAQSWIDPLRLEHVESYKRHLKKKGTRKGKEFTAAGKKRLESKIKQIMTENDMW